MDLQELPGFQYGIDFFQNSGMIVLCCFASVKMQY